MLPEFGLVLLLCHATWSQEINPGLKVQLSEKGLENVKQFAMVNLEALLPTLSIPDMYGTTYMAGEVKYCVTQIQITKFNISNVVLDLLPGTGIQVSISNSQATIANKWKIDSWAIKTSGSSILNLNRISLTAIVVFSSNSAGLPSISLTNCKSDVKDIAVKLNGGISVVNKMMMDHMKTLTRKKMNEQLCLMLIDQIDKWSDKLGKMNFQINLNENIGFDYSPVSTPVITKDDLTLPLKGMFYSRRKPEDIAFSPAPFSLPVLKDNMLCVGVSESVFNSAMHSSFISNAFTLNLDTLVPEGLDVTNNSALAYAFPEAAKQKYTMTGIVKATNAPLVTLKHNNMTIEVELSAQVFAILPNSVQKWLATYNMDASISANVSIQSSDAALYLFGTVTVNRMQVRLANTKTKGNTSGVSEVENAIRNMTEQGLLKTLNVQQWHPEINRVHVQGIPYSRPSCTCTLLLLGEGDWQPQRDCSVQPGALDSLPEKQQLKALLSLCMSQLQRHMQSRDQPRSIEDWSKFAKRALFLHNEAFLQYQPGVHYDMWRWRSCCHITTVRELQWCLVYAHITEDTKNLPHVAPCIQSALMPPTLPHR